MNYYSILLAVISLNCLSFTLAFDSSPLQDFCVAELSSSVSVNGFACKDPKHVEASDFFFSGLNIVGNTSNKLGVKVTPVFVTQLPGLNTLGLSLVRIDFAPSGINPPHTHPRATEILTVLEGTLEVGFITNSPDNRLIKKVLNKGDVFVFPIGLVHYQKNVGNCNVVAVSGLNSQNPGVNIIANAVFKSNPLISTGFLAKSFRTDTTTVEKIKRSI